MRRIDRRAGLLFLGFLGLLLVAGLRAGYLGAVQAGRLRHAAATQQLSQVTVPAPRGTISDRNGIELAVSEPADDVAADPLLVHDAPRLARRIAPLLHVDPRRVLAQLAQRDRGFVYLARDVPARRAAEAQRRAPGVVTLIPQTRRVYPRGQLAAQLLGTVGVDGGGLAGLEYGDDGILGGHDGERRVVKDARGQPISLQDVRPTQPGRDLRLTIDSTLQAKVEQVLAGVGRSYRPKGATAIVMDPRSGTVLALANWPAVNANAFAAGSRTAREDQAAGLNYEPGSTFKAVTVAGALSDHLVRPSTSFYLPPQIQVADRTIHDAEARGPERLTTSQILAQSSNVGAITIGLRLGPHRFDRWVRRFGFGRPTGVDLPGEERGIVLPVDRYSGSSMGNLPIGQGEAVTPLQIASAYAAIADGGILRPAHVVAAVDGHPTARPRGHRIISPRVAGQLRSMLEGVLAPGGTAHEAAIPGYSLAGKTGTANKPDPATGGYSTTKYVASFVGFVPARAPRLLVSIVVDEPHGAIFGGTVAAPAFQKIVSFAVPYLGLPPR